MAEQTVSWQGESGKEYVYWAYPITTTFQDRPGNYIYAKRNSAGRWQAVYIGQTSSLSQRLASHDKERAAIHHGATHILAHLSSDEWGRRAEETDLIRKYAPPLNEAF